MFLKWTFQSLNLDKFTVANRGLSKKQKKQQKKKKKKYRLAKSADPGEMAL